MKKNGYTIIEILIVSAIAGIILLPIVSFFSKNLSGVTKSRNQVQAQECLRQAFMLFEPKILEANEIYTASSSSISFLCDSTMMSTYDSQAITVNGLQRIEDPDDDADASLRLTASPNVAWKFGYDLYDDDDDNDGNIDIMIRIYLDGDKLILGSSENQATRAGEVITEGAWNDKVIADRITRLEFVYYGSKNDPKCENIDLGNDGLPNTGDTGENNGLITATEIDGVLPVNNGVGNGNGIIDTVNERRLISSVQIAVGLDENRNGKEDASLSIEIGPPMLCLKKRN